MTSSEASSSEARSPEAEVHQEMKSLTDSSAGNMFWSCLSFAKRLKECNNEPWDEIWKH